ncbi:hypothetical protein OSB04_028607 [Centaurea solstitialis]|uniref:Retrotransposon gag domain-containing protein n=1 Tax=Centaurea solstitialis TaxID=347529 RepID=A0AA38SUD6_9ASTR|nr:hypothetical protein OSB04_028607 [Centaurea solstitialis]
MDNTFVASLQQQLQQANEEIQRLRASQVPSMPIPSPYPPQHLRPPFRPQLNASVPLPNKQQNFVRPSMPQSPPGFTFGPFNNISQQIPIPGHIPIAASSTVHTTIPPNTGTSSSFIPTIPVTTEDPLNVRLKSLEEHNQKLFALLAKLPGAAVPVEVEPKTRFQASPFVDEIALVDVPKKYSIPAFATKYSGVTDPVEHVAQYKQLMWTVPIPTLYQEVCMCKSFGSTLTGAALQWLINLKPKSIGSFAELVNQFTRQFASSRKMEKQTSDLYYVVQKPGETIHDNFNRFNAAMIKVKSCDVKTAIEAYKRGLEDSSGLYLELTKYPPENFDDIGARTLAFMRIEDDALFRRKHSSEKKPLSAHKHDFKHKRVNKIGNPRHVSKTRPSKVTADLLEPFEEPEREFRKRNKKKSKADKVRPRTLIFEMGDEAPMWTARRAAPTVPTNPITKPGLNKEIPGKLLHMIKDLTFNGKHDSNPIVHMENFVDICDLFKTEEGRDDAIRLRVFPLTLTGEARAWLRLLEPSSITTWEGLRSKFLSRFFPPSKIDKLRADIRSFQQDDGETISEAWEHFKHLLNSCPSHGLNKSEQVQTFYSGLAYSSRATLDSSAGGVFMYKTPTEGYKLLEDMLIHNIDWRTDKCLQIPRMAGKISTDFDPSDELAAMKNQQVKFERKIEELIKSVHALQVGCEECNGPHLTKDCPNRPMMTPEKVNYLNRGDYQGRWSNNRNFIPRPPGFFAPTQQNQRPDGEPRVSIEDRIVQFMDAQKKLNDEVSSYLRNHQSTIQNLELQVGRVSQMLSERTQGELPTQTQVNPKVENVKPMLMMTGEPSKKKWTDIYTKKYVETESESEPDYATDYDSEGFTVSFEHLRLKVPEASSDDEEEDGKQGGYAEFVIPMKEDKGKEKEKEKAPEDDLIYIAPIKHDPGSYNLPISCHKFKGLALVDSGAALNLMPVGYCRKMGVKNIIPTDYQYRGVNGYMTKPLGIAEGVPIRIGNFVYYTDFVIANLPQNTEIPIILGRSFLHTAQVNTDMRNQVTSLGYGENRIYFDPNGEPVRHLDEPYEDPSLAYKKNTNRPLLPHEHGKKKEDYPNPMHQKDHKLIEPEPSKKDHRKKKGSSSRRAKK